MVTELLQYHQKGGAKLANKKHYVVDVHPNFSDTRCLFVVKEDGTREDFSILKCINKIEEKFSVWLLALWCCNGVGIFGFRGWVSIEY